MEFRETIQRFIQKASATKGVTGEVLLQLCEARLIT
jgi:hypothetical protein